MSQPAFKRHPFDEAQAAELARWPGIEWRREVRGKHFAIVLTRGNVSRFVTYAGTPGDEWRGAQNHIRDLRKELTALGATRTQEAKSQAPKRQRNRTEPSRLNLASVADTKLAKDPFAALATIHFPEPVQVPKPSFLQRLAGLFRRPNIPQNNK